MAATAGGSSDPKPATGYPAFTAYPYPAAPYYGAAPPHPQQQQPPPYYNNVNPDCHNANNNPYHAPGDAEPVSLHCCLCPEFLFILLVGGCVAIGILWLVFHFSLPTVSVTSAAVSSFNFSASSSLLTSNFDFTLSVYNPNKKMPVSYYNVETAVFLGSALVAENPIQGLPPFSQGEGNSTVITAKLAAVAQYLEDTSALAICECQVGVLYVNLRLFSGVKFGDGGLWKKEGLSLKVYCNDLKISLVRAGATTGSLVGGPTSCLVSL